jgi:hypothetical protein
MPKINYAKIALNKVLASVPKNVANQVRAYHSEMLAIRKASKPTERIIEFENETNFVPASVGTAKVKELQKKYPLAVPFLEGKYKGGKQKTRRQKKRRAVLTRRNRRHAALTRRRHH